MRWTERLAALLLTFNEIPPSTCSDAPSRQPSLILFSLGGRAMWIRKSKAKIDAQQRHERFGVGYPALAALMLTVVISFLNWAGFASWSGFMYPRQSLVEVAIKFPLWFLGFFVFVYIWQVLAPPWRPRFRGEPLICSVCRRTFTAYPPPVAWPCGGALEPLRYWRWVEDEHSAVNT
jgi:hypothetical protein